MKMQLFLEDLCHDITILYLIFKLEIKIYSP